jgi:rRNA processing protein Gar1
LQRLGRAIHVTPSRNIIIKVETPPKIGEKIVDEQLRQIGTVSDVFGPVSSPYVTVKPTVEHPGLVINQMLYAIPSSRQTARRKENRE